MLGRRRVSVTVYEYDDDGRLVRSVTTHDPEFLDEDLGYGKAHRRNEMDLCPTCRMPLSETTDPDNEGRYEVPPPIRCHACTPIQHSMQEYKDSPPGLLFRAYLKVKKAVGRT